jgi:hypothetical protein
MQARNCSMKCNRNREQHGYSNMRTHVRSSRKQMPFLIFLASYANFSSLVSLLIFSVSKLILSVLPGEPRASAREAAEDCFDLAGKERPAWAQVQRRAGFSFDHVLRSRPPGTVRIGHDIGDRTGPFASRMREHNRDRGRSGFAIQLVLGIRGCRPVVPRLGALASPSPRRGPAHRRRRHRGGGIGASRGVLGDLEACAARRIDQALRGAVVILAFGYGAASVRDRYPTTTKTLLTCGAAGISPRRHWRPGYGRRSSCAAESEGVGEHALCLP